MFLATVFNSKKACKLIVPVCLKQSRKYSDELAGPQIETVNLSYASYENTESVQGDPAPPLIICHGLFGSKTNWNSLSKAFHKKTVPQRKVVAVDLRNHGDSPHVSKHTYKHLAEDVKVLLGNLNIKKACLLGHSMGGRTVMMFALKYPELVDKLLVADISPVSNSHDLGDTGDIIEVLKKIRMPKQGPMSTVRAQVDRQLAPKIQSKMVRAFLLTNLVQKADGTFAWRVNLPVLSASFREEIGKFPKFNFVTFKGPTLFIGGEKSDMLPKRDHPEITKVFPNAVFKYVDGATHWLTSDKPAEFLKICTEFLNKSNPTPALQ